MSNSSALFAHRRTKTAVLLQTCRSTKMIACAVQVESLAGSGLSISFGRDATVGDAKRRLAAALPEHPASDGVSLVCGGRVLRDEEPLPAEAGAVVHVVLSRSRSPPSPLLARRGAAPSS